MIVVMIIYDDSMYIKVDDSLVVVFSNKKFSNCSFQFIIEEIRTCFGLAWRCPVIGQQNVCHFFNQ